MLRLLLRPSTETGARALCRRLRITFRPGFHVDEVWWAEDHASPAFADALAGPDGAATWASADEPAPGVGVFVVETADSGAPLAARARRLARGLGLDPAILVGAASRITWTSLPEEDEERLRRAWPDRIEDDPSFQPEPLPAAPPPEVIPFRGRSGMLLNRAARGYGLDTNDLLHVQEYFRLNGRDPNTLELAWIADAWREERCDRTLTSTLRIPDASRETEEIAFIGDTLTGRSPGAVTPRVLILRDAARFSEDVARSAVSELGAGATASASVSLGTDPHASLSLRLMPATSAPPVLAFAAGDPPAVSQLPGGSAGDVVLWVRGHTAVARLLADGLVTAAADAGAGLRHAAVKIGADTGVHLDLDAFPPQAAPRPAPEDPGGWMAAALPGSTLIAVSPDSLPTVRARIDQRDALAVEVGELLEDGPVRLVWRGTVVAELVAGMALWGWPRRDRPAVAPTPLPPAPVTQAAVPGGIVAASAFSPDGSAGPTAEAVIRAVAAAGARELAVGLTWGNTEDAASLGALAEALRGIGAAARAAGVQVRDLKLCGGVSVTDAEGHRRGVPAVIAAFGRTGAADRG